MGLDGTLACRAATLEDKEAVCAISKQSYNGLDYVPDVYEDAIRDPSCYCYVLEKGDEIIGFMGHRLSDKGTATLAGMMRLKVEYQGQGLIKILDRFTVNRIRKEHPGIKVYRYVTKNYRQVRKRIEDPTSGYQLLAHLVEYTLKTTAIKVKAKLIPRPRLETKTVIPVREALKSKHFTKPSLNLEESVFFHSVYWVPEAVSWENIAAAAKKQAAYVTISRGNACTALSFSDLHISERGYVVNLHFSSLDGATFDVHFQRHLNEIIKNIPAEAQLYMHVLGPNKQKALKNVLTEYGEIIDELEVFAVEGKL